MKKIIQLFLLIVTITTFVIAENDEKDKAILEKVHTLMFHTG